MPTSELNNRLNTSSVIKTSLKTKTVYHLSLLCINMTSIILGIIYYINYSSNTLWNIYGVIIIVALLLNILSTYISDNGSTSNYIYLILNVLFMAIIPIQNTSASADLNNEKAISLVSAIMLFSLFVYGFIGNCFKLVKLRDRKKNSSNRQKSSIRKSNNVGKAVAIIIVTLLFMSGIFVVVTLLTKGKKSMAEVFIPEYSVFYGFIFLGLSAIAYNLMSSYKTRIIKYVFPVAGLIIYVICLLPLISIPTLIKEADKSYAVAFGAEDRAKVEKQYKDVFRNTAFSLPDYFFGTPSKKYDVKENVLFYEGKDGVDKGVKLYFDAYTPASKDDNLPGKNSVLIRIHGGGWTIGDKGQENYAEVNKYFASQGYIVFDVQYGLSNKEKFVKYAKVPENVVGDFNIDDMMRHLGIFTKYLAKNKDLFSANLNSVFISGGSAGGQLANALALGITSGKYSDLLDSSIKVKGLIPFYPANGLSKNLGIGGQNDFVDPKYLVTPDSPPVLMYQGNHDGIVNPDIAELFKETYIKNQNNKIDLMYMPYGTHGSDEYFSSYYNQVFMYYMERFMAQYR
ncbi:alpha/beta hydrolase [Clostridium sp. C8-1-8]|uniref:alpha/beta hydrolase n=1 Tax=Clostridium sp. C8-1-8 TaxID=2698831 RepID=UPI00136EE1DF|nr:alpha/beta hydrolase [Clostridium sp. C8-1-8]